MANEVTAASVDDFSYSAIIAPVLLATLSERATFLGWAREFNIVSQPSAAMTIPSIASYWGTPNDRGAAVDTELNATEVTDIANTPITTGTTPLSTGEYGIAHELSDRVVEDTIDSLDLLNVLRGTMMTALQLALADDFVALFANLATTLGTTTVDMSIATLLAAKNTIRIAGGQAPDGIGYILDQQAFIDIENAFVATNAAAAVYALTADRILAYQPAANAGMAQPDNRVATFRGDPVITTGLTDTANAGADVVSGAITRSTQANDELGLTTFGQAWKRFPRFETERHPRKRSTTLVMTIRWGAGELQDLTGAKIISDAPA